MSEEQAATIAFLSDPAAYGLVREAVERHETHGSIVFLAGERAYKLKRAVKFPYMDYSTPARRQAMCAAELEANHRLAPEIYLGVEPVMRAPDGGLHIGRTGEDGRIVDWLVVMRRFEQGALLESRRRRGELGIDLMRRLGERVAAFHGSAERSLHRGGARGIAAVVDENRDLIGKLAGRPFDPRKIARLDARAADALAQLRPLLEERRESGFVRRCHGDLHLNNICVIADRPIPFDAIEFLDEFVWIDVLFDLAFLLMDLDRHGLRAEANVVLNRYLECTGDYSGLAALPLFLSCRAALRAHILVAMAAAAGGTLDGARAAEAAHLLDCAIAYLEPAGKSLLAIGGVSGTGKSTLAAALAPGLGRAPGAIVLRSDVVRKRLCGVDDLTPLPASGYAPSVTQQVYDAVAALSERILEAGSCAIADAVFGDAEPRARIKSVAENKGAEFCGLWLTAPTDALEQRVAGRHHDASDATAAVLHDQLARIEAPRDWTTIDAGMPPDLVCSVARAVLGVEPPN